MSQAVVVCLALVLAVVGDQRPAVTEDGTLSAAVDKLVGDLEEAFILERSQVTPFDTVKLWRQRGRPTKQDSSNREHPVVQARISRFASGEAASKALEKERRYAQVSPMGTIENLGEQSYVWVSPSGRSATIRFRRANVMVLVSGTSRELAERFAFHVLGAIDERLAASDDGLIEK